ncbi:MAG: ABC transporter permease [Alphaproteobacteria bacterium]|nr:ABC transporter permease [Alphaproteobacteria bacterium]
MKKTLIALAAGLAIAGATGAAAQTKITIGMSGWTGFAPLTLADKAGIFKQNGLDVELKNMPQKDRLAALAAGSLQGAATTIDTHVVWGGAGVPLVQVLLLDKSNGGDGMVVRGAVQKVADLKGKTIAVDGAGTVPHFMLSYILKKNGMTLKDLKLETLGPQQAANAFLAGQFDAAMTYEPYMSGVRDKPEIGKILVTTKDYPVVVDTLGFRADFVKANPQAVQAVTKSWFEALEMIKKEPAKAHEIMGAAVKQTGEQFAKSASYIEWQSKAANQAYLAKDIHEFMAFAAGILSENGVIRQSPDLKAMASTDFVK